MRKSNRIRSSSVADWFAEEEVRTPGFIADCDAHVEHCGIATKLRDMRRAARVTRSQVAELAGVTPEQVARMEEPKNGATPSFTVLACVAGAFGKKIRMRLCRRHVPGIREIPPAPEPWLP